LLKFEYGLLTVFLGFVGYTFSIVLVRMFVYSLAVHFMQSCFSYNLQSYINKNCLKFLALRISFHRSKAPFFGK